MSRRQTPLHDLFVPAFTVTLFWVVFGDGFHSNKHGRAILPDSLRWLWRGWESEQPK